MNKQSPVQSRRLGLIAGNGKFPLLFARQAKKQHYTISAAAIKGDTTALLCLYVDRIRWFNAGELRKFFEYFKQEGVVQVLMAGQVNPENLFDERVELDNEFRDLFAALRDRKADTIFTAVANKLKEQGMELLDSTFLVREHLAPRGTLTRRAPTEAELDDIVFGTRIAKQMGAIDVGQTVVVKDKAIVAIEAMEGTDRAIMRGGAIARAGAVIIKMSKPNQDLRFDVPVIGPRTIMAMRQVKAQCIAIEAGKTLVIDREKTIGLANKFHLCIVAA